MRLIYIDEAGNTGSFRDPDQPLHMIGALIVDESRVRLLQDALTALADSYAETVARSKLGAARSASGLPPYTSADIEFHGSEIYGGKKLWAGVEPAARIDLCKSIVSLCKEAEGVFGSCIVDKIKLHGGHPHLRCFQFTLERLQDYLVGHQQLGLIIADEHRELEEQIIKDLSFSQSFSTGWGYRPTKVENIVDTVHFVKSCHNRIVQACDVLTYFRLKGERIMDRIIQAYLKDPMNTLEFKTYCDAHSKPAEAAALEIYRKIRDSDIFNKRWPTAS